MNRTVVMTLGFLLVFFGIQLNVVDSFVLTPRMTNFLSDQLADAPAIPNSVVSPSQQPGPFTQAGYSNGDPNTYRTPVSPRANRVIHPPGWIGWPIMFLGAVFFLNGVAIRK
ncbi:hypothetical protein [Mariniblastus fucicola]|uniref:Uncharacterized protein n=1 Tax=Mariniblastus fucicola TaxID=980251 RepID=A0A5B9P2V8_9BACT|nr:hypothetical protein [Mariniblastus fucicola]QEG20867.1 hypothetical protein MFFC18_07180 [Mariniblastus fucicola]